MTFKELPVGKKFIVLLNGDGNVYTKINDRPRRNTRYKSEVFTIHSNNYVKEIK